MNNNKIITEKEYRVWKGASWPTYENFINNNFTVDETIRTEINEFIKLKQKQYHELTDSKSTELSLANQSRQKQIFFNKDYSGKKCKVPWKTMGINSNGNIYICESPSWIPIFIGNILETENIFDILNNDTALKIRQEIEAGRYYYCNSKICSFFSNIDESKYNQNPKDQEELILENKGKFYVDKIPSTLIFDFDYTCNFQCPSCRTETINWNHSPIREHNNKLVAKIKSLVLDKITSATTIRWCGGEPFTSEVYLDIFEYLANTKTKHVNHVVQTNGSLLISKKDILLKLLPTVKEMRISFDAGCEETYKITRVGGHWNNLLENVKFLTDLINDNNFKTQVYADFVVQKNNYMDLPVFVKLCKQLKLKINIQKMWNWGTWDDDTFKEMNVYDKDNILYKDVIHYFKISNLPLAKN